MVSNKIKENIISIVLTLGGLLLFTLRMLAIQHYWESVALRDRILHISNFLSIIVAICLILELRIAFLNSVVVVLLPATFLIAIVDIIWMIMGVYPVTIDRLTVHIPSAIIGLYLLINILKRSNLINIDIAIIFLMLWGFIVDPRVFDFLFFYGEYFLIGLIVAIGYLLSLNILLIEKKKYMGFIYDPIKIKALDTVFTFIEEREKRGWLKNE